MKIVRVWIALLAALLIAGCSPKEYLDSIKVKNPDMNTITDGVYTGTYKLDVPFGVIAVFPEVTVSVSVSNHRYTDIRISNGYFYDTNENDSPEDIRKSKYTFLKMLDEILAKQTIEVDATTGASVSSKATLKAIEKALTK